MKSHLISHLFIFCSAIIIVGCTAIPTSYATDLFVDPTGNDANDCLSAGNACKTVMGAIGKAVSGDVINIAAGNYNETIDIIGINLTLQGADRTTTILDATGTGQGVVDIFGTATVTINDMTIQKGEAGDGGGIELDSFPTLTLNDCILTENTTGSNGGAIYSPGGSVTINRCLITKNSATGGGGSIEVNNASLTISDSEISENMTNNEGGGLRITGATASLSLTNTLLKKNEAGSIGGGLSLEGGGSVSIDGATFDQNTAVSNGGGISAIGGDLFIEDTRFTANESNNIGGGIFINGTELSIETSLFDQNIAGTDAGGLAHSSGLGPNHVNNTTFSGNTADQNGGGIYNNNGNLVLNNVTVTGNTADADDGGDAGDGGGIANNDVGPATTTLRNTIVAGNSDPSSDPDCFGTITSDGFNLIETVSASCTFAETTGDITGEDPLLDALADNGGPTPTHALPSNSPALDKGSCLDSDSSDVFEDQRGSERPTENCDIGAFEVSVCGDDLIGADEECEDGNTVDTDDCTNQCKFNICGDGSVLEDFEECDDGNTTSGDGCDSDCFKENPLEGCALNPMQRNGSKSFFWLSMGLILMGLSRYLFPLANGDKTDQS